LAFDVFLCASAFFDPFPVSLIIRKPGILTTVRDLGRVGYRRLGINPGGAMDTAAARIANILLGNDENSPVMEMYFPAPQIEFESDAAIAICGGDFGAELDGQPVPNWSAANVRAGSLISFGRKIEGNVAYIAISGRLHADEWLGSSSTSLIAGMGGYHGRRLAAGDQLEFAKGVQIANSATGASLRPRYSRFPTVRIVPGNEFEFLTADSAGIFLGEGFTFTKECDRMGYRLAGKPLNLLDEVQMVSAAVNFGTIQLLPDGQIIVLMADHQTSGGYPRIGNVISVDLPILAQCGPGDGVSFAMVSIDEAERLALQFEGELNFLRVGCRLRNQNVDR
jgi:antagonist of KipI